MNIPRCHRVDSARLMRWSVALLLVYAGTLAACATAGVWFVTSDGLKETDFVNVWAAGRLALEGHAEAVYDWAVHRRMEVAALGHDMAGYYGWHYPPMLLFAAVPLSLLPYLAAWLTWSALTAAFLCWGLWRIVPQRAMVPALMAAPATLWCVVTGQNGFLTAGLMGAALVFAERRPLLAGVFLGLLTYKPQFGLLFPVALIAGRHWRLLTSATATTLVLAVSSALAFGMETWRAFFRSVTTTVDGVLRVGGPGWSKLQSVYALLHPLGESWAMAGHGVVVLVLAALVAWTFARPRPFAVQASVLASASVVATPYGYIYDLPVLAVAVAFLLRDGSRRGFLAGEVPLLAAALLMPFLFPLLGSATTLAVVLIVAGVTLRRWRFGLSP